MQDCPIIIFGAGAIGKLALEIFNQLDRVVYGFLDDDQSSRNTLIDDITVFGKNDDEEFLKYIGKKCHPFVAVEDEKRKIEIINLLKKRKNVFFPNAIHPHGHIASHVHIGAGNLVDAGVIISTRVHIANYCHIHAGATLGYEAHIENSVQLGIRTTINAKVIVGENSLIGAGATVASGVKIAKNVKIAPGAVVFKDIPENAVVLGNPAEVIKK